MSDLPTANIRPFSLRHQRAIADGRIAVELPERLRNRLWSTMGAMDEQISYAYKDNPSYWHTDYALSLADAEYARLLGVSTYDKDGRRTQVDIQAIIHHGPGYHVLDVVEIYMALHAGAPAELRAVQRSVNDAFVDFACPWRLADGMFFKLDSTFLEEEVLGRATDILGCPELAGAHEEFMKARDHLTDGNARDAITYAGSSVESTLKAVTGGSGDLSKLTQAFVEYGMNDIDKGKAKAAKKALEAVGTLRNELGAHGQGASIVDVPTPYAALAVHLAAAINHFVATQHLARMPPEEPATPKLAAGYTRGSGAGRPDDYGDDIPF